VKSIDELKSEAQAKRINVAAVVERFSRSGGPGGQNVNKVATAVSLSYPPMNLVVSCEDHRSQLMNRAGAWQQLIDKVIAARRKITADLRAEREKERRRNRPRPRGVKERILKAKKQRSDLKRQRSVRE